MTEEEESQSAKEVRETVHVEGKYSYQNLELAREAAEVACHAAAKLHPSQIKTMDDDDWTGHPDRSD
jgi:hypothetical protein